MRALIYTRVSADRAQGRSPAEQEAEARDVCQREGWPIVDVVTDSVGASRHSKGTRSGWAKVKRLLAEGGVDVLVTWEASRAQRDLVAYVELRDLCVKARVRWCYSGRVYDLTDGDDRFRTGLDALLAESEADKTAERVKRAIRANALAGRPHGRRLFGYRRVYDPDTGRLVTQEIDETEAPLIRRIFDEYLTGVGVRTVARTLNAEGVQTATGKRWTDAQVHDVLTRAAYTALRQHQGVVIGEAGWPPIIERGRWEAAQRRLEQSRTGEPVSNRAKHLLIGTARCGVCRAKLHRAHDRNRRKTYLCGERFCVGRDLKDLDLYVAGALLKYLTVNPFPAGPNPDAEHARGELAALRGQVDDALAAFRAGHLSAALLGRVEADVLPLITAAERRMRRAAVPDIDLPTSGFEDWWEGLLIEQQRAVLRAFVAEVLVYPTRRGVKVFNPEAVEIVWR